jgi:dienelactone hydrolase
MAGRRPFVMASTMRSTPSGPPRRRLARALLLVTVALVVLLIRPAGAHLRAASLLLRFADAGATGALADFGRHAVVESTASVTLPQGEARARVYTPTGVVDPPGVVVVHGVHRLGVDEPRLQRFARAIAATGVVVFTPEVQEIADYRIDPRSIDTIGAAAAALRTRLGHGRVGVMGMSFAGGLSLLAAADPRFEKDIGFVVAIGAHDDLGRVLRFFATDEIDQPDGVTVALKAHEYGALVMIHGNTERFFPAADVPAAREALRFRLWEQPDAAREKAKELGPESRAIVEALFEGRLDPVRPALLAAIAQGGEAMSRVSPHGHLGAIHVPVFLLHGQDDTVIPAAETLWIASEVPPAELRVALVSPAIVHVEIHGEPPLGEKWALVHFMAGVLAEADSAHE